MFTIEGHYQGKPASITWDEGELSGDQSAIRQLKKLARERDSVEVIGMGPISTNAHLSKALPAMILISQVLHPITESNGDLPQLPDVPPDAVV